jgi:hypothetical protein
LFGSSSPDFLPLIVYTGVPPILTLQKPHIPASFNMYLVINKCVTAVKVTNFSGHYLRNRSTSDIGVLGYIGILYHKEHPPEVWHIPPGTPCLCSILRQFQVGLWLDSYNSITSTDTNKLEGTQQKFASVHLFAPPPLQVPLKLLLS